MRRRLLVCVCLLVAVPGCEEDAVEKALRGLGDRNSEYLAFRPPSMDRYIDRHALPPIERVAAFGARAVDGLAKLLKTGTTAQRWDAAIAAGLIGKEAAVLEGPLLACAAEPALEEAAVLALTYVAIKSQPFRNLVERRFKQEPPPAYVLFPCVFILSPFSAADRARLIAYAKELPAAHETSIDAYKKDRKKARDAARRSTLARISAWALGYQRRRAAHEVPDLVEAAPRGGREYFTALSRIDTLAARDALLEFLKSKDEKTSLLALEALSSIDPAPAVVWPTLEAQLISKDPFGALLIIEDMGDRAHRLMPRLLPLIARNETRWVALRTLATLGPLSAEARKALKPLLEAESDQVRRLAGYLLEKGKK